MLGSPGKTWLDVEGVKQGWSWFTVGTGAVSVSLPFWYWHGFVHLFDRTVFVHHLYN